MRACEVRSNITEPPGRGGWAPPRARRPDALAAPAADHDHLLGHGQVLDRAAVAVLELALDIGEDGLRQPLVEVEMR